MRELTTPSEWGFLAATGIILFREYISLKPFGNRITAILSLPAIILLIAGR